MKSFRYRIRDVVGIHARPAGLLAKEAKKYVSTITITKGDKSAEAQKLLAVMALGIGCGEEITVFVEGEDEESAAPAMQRFFEENM